MKRLILWLLGFLALAFVPLVVHGYWVRLLTNVWMYSVLVLSLNVIVGYTGYLALGNVVFFGVGAYVAAVSMTNYGLPFFHGLILGGVGSAVLAALVGTPILRLTGRYFLMATLGLMYLCREIIMRLPFTGGGSGINLPVLSGSPAFVNNYFYFLILFLMLVCVAVSLLIEGSRFGYGLRAIRYDEEAALIMGIPVRTYKTVAWTISAFLTGLAGGAYAYWMTYIDPQTVFDIWMSVMIYLMLIFGGVGSILGGIIGAGLIQISFDLVWAKFMDLRYIVLGLLVLLIASFIPNGVAGLAERWWRYRAKKPVEGFCGGGKANIGGHHKGN